MAKNIEKEPAREAKTEEVSIEELERSLADLEAMAGINASDEDDEEADDEDVEDEGLEASDDEDSDEEGLEAAAEDESDEEPVEEVVAKSVKKATKKIVAKAVEEKSDEWEKSLPSEELYEDENLMKAIEISPFLESFVDRSGEAMDNLAKSVEAQTQELLDQNRQIMKAFTKTFRAFSETVKAIDERLAKIEATPAKPKGVTNVLERSFEGNQAKPAAPSLTKSMVSDALVSLCEKEVIPPYEVARFESTGQLSQSTQKLVLDHWKSGAAA